MLNRYRYIDNKHCISNKFDLAVRDPLKSSVTDPSLLVNCYLAKNRVNTEHPPPPPPNQHMNITVLCSVNSLKPLQFPHITTPSNRELDKRSANCCLLRNFVYCQEMSPMLFESLQGRREDLGGLVKIHRGLFSAFLFSL